MPREDGSQKVAPQPLGVMFHHFRGAGHPAGQGDLSGEELAAMIEFLGPRRILPAEEWLGRALEGALDVDDLCLTFDDNLRCQYDVALPVLRAYGLTAFWFVATATLTGAGNPVEIDRAFRTRCFDAPDDFYHAFFRMLSESELAEPAREALDHFDPSAYLSDFPFYSEPDRRFRFVRDEVLGPRNYRRLMDRLITSSGQTRERLAGNLWMNRDCLRHLHEDGHVIGLHSHTHPTRLERLSPSQQHAEYAENQQMLRSVLGRAPQVAAHPCNSYSEETLHVLRGLGVALAFRANTALSEFSELEYPREDHANILREMRACGSRYSPATSRVTWR